LLLGVFLAIIYKQKKIMARFFKLKKEIVKIPGL